MPRRKNQIRPLANNPRGRAPTQTGYTEIVTGRSLFQTSTADANGMVAEPLYPGLISTRLGTFDDLFMEYKFTYLRFTAVQPRAGTTVYAALVPVKVDSGLLPTTRFEVSETEGAVAFWYNSVTPQHLIADRKFLEGSRETLWFKTQPSSGVEDALEYQVTLVLGPLAATTGFAEFFVEYEVQYRGRVPPALSSETKMRSMNEVAPIGELVSIVPFDGGRTITSESPDAKRPPSTPAAGFTGAGPVSGPDPGSGAGPSWIASASGGRAPTAVRPRRV